MKKLLVLLALAAAALAAAAALVFVYFTPHLALGRIQASARAGDTARLAEQVDFPRVRASLKQQVRGRIDEAARAQGGPLAALGSAFAGALAEPAVEALVTPQNVAALLRGEPLGGSGATVDLSGDDVDLHYDAWDRFVAVSEPPGGFQIVLTRDGLVGWKLTDVRLPASWRLPASAG